MSSCEMETRVEGKASAFCSSGGRLSRVWSYIQWLYLQYAINLGIIVLEPCEIVVFHILVAVVVASMAYTTYLFLPSHLFMLSRFFFGSTEESATTSASSDLHTSSGLKLSS